MWPILHDMTRDDCRRALRRLELEAYTSVISVFRAQGALADDRKKLLEEIRSALSISNDRHSAEARRVSNDELLGTIAQQLSGPNTDMGWFSEGRREIPILPRGIPQTMYTAMADEAIKEVIVENEKFSIKAERKAAPVSPKSPVETTPEDMELDETSAATAESGKSPNVYATKGKNTSEGNYPPVVMWDQWLKKASNDEGPPRKRSRADSSTQHHRPTQQRYLNISQYYNNYSKTPTAKSANQYGKNAYGQTGKVSGKSNHASKSSMSKQRSMQNKHSKQSGQVAIPHHQVRSGIKSPNDHHMAGSQALNIQNILDTSAMKTQTSDFQANFIQSLEKNINLEEHSEAKHSNVTANILESPTMQLLTQPPPASSPSPPHDEMTNVPVSGQGTVMSSHILSASPTVTKVQQSVSGKPCHLIIKKKGEVTVDNSSSHKIQVSNMQVISKPSEMSGIKVLQNRQVVVAPPQTVSQKLFNSSGKLITTKIVQQIPQKAQTPPTPTSKSLATNTMMEKIMVVSKSPAPVQPGILQRSLSNASTKNVLISGQNTFNAVSKDVELGNQISKGVDVDGAPSKGVAINNSEMKLSTKTFLLNPKSGQKMVVVPAKSRGKGSIMGQTMPLLQVKGIHGRPTMKLVPVSSQSVSATTKSSNITVVSGASNILTTKIISKESLMHIKPNVMSGEGTVNKMPSNVQMSSKSSGQAIIRPAAAKGNVILLQKGNPLGKGPITLTKNEKDLSKIVMSGKRTSQSLPQVTPVTPNRDLQEATTMDSSVNVSKNPGNVIVLELRNDQMENESCGQEYLEGDEASTALTPNDHLNLKAKHTIITEDTPVLFHNQLSNDVCNADSMESTADSLMGGVHISDTMKSSDSFPEDQEMQKISSQNKASEDQTVSSVITDWDMELDNATDKAKISKSDEANMELEESSDSDTDEYMATAQPNKKIIQHTTGDDSLIRDPVNTDTSELYTPHTSISQASRTLLSQLQDEGSSSNDSPFVLSKDLGKTPTRLLSKFKVQTEHSTQSLSKASIKSKSAQESKEGSNPALDSESAQPMSNSGQSCSVKSMSRPGRMDIFRTALVSADINLESFEYLEDGMMSTEEIFPLKGPESIPDKDKIHQSLEQQLNQLLNEDIDSTRLEVLESPQIGSGAIE